MSLSWCWFLVCLSLAATDANAYWRIPVKREPKLNVLYEWKYIDYDFGSDELRQKAIDSGNYEPTSNSPIDVDRWKEETFVTVIRSEGVPSSLNTISNKVGKGGPLLKPYPDWSWANTSSCDSIISVYRVAIDRCDRLWVIDNGKIDDNFTCPAQLLAFDLNTSKLLKRVKIPDNIARNTTTGNGLLVTPIVRTFGRDCRYTNVFIADVEGYGLIIYDGNSLKRYTSTAFVYDPKVTTYTIEGQSFQLQDGILGMDYSYVTDQIYLSPMSSRNMASVNVRQLLSNDNDNVQYKIYENVLTTQSSAKAISKSGILFFGLVNETAIGCWNENRPLNKQNIDVAVRNRTTLQFTSGLKIKDSREGEVLYAFTNRYQKLATGTLNIDEVNFRILSEKVSILVEGTKCRPYSFYRYF